MVSYSSASDGEESSVSVELNVQVLEDSDFSFCLFVLRLYGRYVVTANGCKLFILDFAVK